jgi:molecular chaperone GrpE
MARKKTPKPKAAEPTPESPPPEEGAVQPVEAAEEAAVEAAEGISLIELEPDSPLARAERTIDELQARLRTVSAAYQRQLEEVAETKARMGRQAAMREELRRGEVVGGLFEPLQNLRRSVESVEQGASADDTVAGLLMVIEQFDTAFEKLGIEEVPGKGATFDPNLHEALSMVPTTDAALDGVVLEVFSPGYRIGSRLIQPARVVVGQLQESVGDA